MATENPRWGYSRIRGALRNLGHRVARSTIARILKESGIEPSPERPTPWSTFLRAHWGHVVATDFLTVEVWSPFTLVTHYVLFFIDLRTRRILFSEVARNPDDAFMVGVGRYLTDPIFGCLARVKLLICDHDGRFSPAFRNILSAAGIRIVRTHRWAPNCNAYAERFVRSIKEECLERMIFFGPGQLQRAVHEYVEHYNRERNHQGLGNNLLERRRLPRSGPVQCRERLGGMLRYYHRAA
jgi:transposase InsO family protein